MKFDAPHTYNLIHYCELFEWDYEVMTLVYVDFDYHKKQIKFNTIFSLN